MSTPKNLAASVKARLLTLARSRGETFNDLLTRYGIERLLYRLGRSSQADQFLLKGAMLFVLWDSLSAAERPGEGPAFFRRSHPGATPLPRSRSYERSRRLESGSWMGAAVTATAAARSLRCCRPIQSGKHLA